MWYKVQFPPYGLLQNYLCYDFEKGFYLGSRSHARFFRKEHFIYDNKLKEYLSGKEYVIERCNGKHTFLIYRGDIM